MSAQEQKVEAEERRGGPGQVDQVRLLLPLSLRKTTDSLSHLTTANWQTAGREEEKRREDRGPEQKTKEEKTRGRHPPVQYYCAVSADLRRGRPRQKSKEQNEDPARNGRKGREGKEVRSVR
jgi:hypothetical protein